MNSLVAIPVAGALPIALAGRDVAAASEVDPIFALIEDHRADSTGRRNTLCMAHS